MKSSYRPEIDGLRALAVLPVIFFHAGIEAFNGGYVGVDIFFVVSGYLITSVILKDIEREKFSITYFYQRRARRILPALITTIALSLPIAVILLPPSDLENFAKSIISSLTFWSNFQFSSESGYFATPGEYKPLLHTWSLSIEEQFYILYPLFFVFFFKINKKKIHLLILIILFLSLFFAQWSGNLNFKYPFIDEDLLFYSNSSFTEFMMPFGRIWELALGATCAFLINSKNNYFQAKGEKILLFNFFSSIGIFLIFFSFFYLSKDFPYPSFYTLIPTLGTALLILFSQKNTFVKNILSYKILVFIGLISYSAYLFHYPIFSFIKYVSTNINNYIYIFVIPLVLFFSFLNWKFVEQPFRKKNSSFKKLILFVSISYLFLISIGVYIYLNDGLNKRERFVLPKNIESSFIFSENGRKCFDIDYIHKKENQKQICKIGNLKNEKLDFVVFGDSHIVSFYTLIDELSKKNKKSGLFVGYSGCPPILNVYNLRMDQKEKNCYELNKSILELVNKQKINNLIFISKWVYYTDGDHRGANLNALSLEPRRSSNETLSKEAFTQGLMSTLEEYKKIGKKVFIVEQAPFQRFNPKQIYYRSFNKDKTKFAKKLSHYSLHLDQHKKHQIFVKKTLNNFEIKYNNLILINLDDVFCENPSKKCLIGNEKYSFYIDESHLSTQGANLTRGKFTDIIEKF